MDPPFDPDRHHSVAGYLAYELSAEWRYDYYEGRIRPTTYSGYPHSGITSALLIAVDTLLDELPFEAFPGGVRVVVDPERCLLHPDLTVFARPPKFMLPTDNILILEPVVIFEVYSAETEADDRGDRFDRYRRIPSLAEYVLLSADEPLVETFRRLPDKTWTIGSVTRELKSTFALKSIGVEVAMAKVYRRDGGRSGSGRQPTV